MGYEGFDCTSITGIYISMVVDDGLGNLPGKLDQRHSAAYSIVVVVVVVVVNKEPACVR